MGLNNKMDARFEAVTGGEDSGRSLLGCDAVWIW